MNAAAYIAELQKQCGLDELDGTMQSDEFKREMLRLTQIGAPETYLGATALLDDLTRSAKQLSDEITAAITRLSYSPSTLPEIGILPFADFNAWASRSPDGFPICILAMTLSKTLFILSQCLAEYTVVGPDTAERVDVQKCFLGLIAACEDFLRNGDSKAQAYLRTLDFKRDGAWYLFGGIMTKAMEQFVLAHELAHHIKGHACASTPRKIHSGARVCELQLFSRSQSDELEADQLGADIFLECQRGARLVEMQCAPLFYFEFMTFGYKHILKDEGGADPAASHPAPTDRLNELKRHMWPRMDQRARDYYEHTALFWRNARIVAQMLERDGLL